MNKNILLTGATGGIGKTTVNYLMERNFNCIVVGRDKNKLKDITDGNDKAKSIEYDLRDIRHIGDIFKNLYEDGIKLDGMVHCAGLSPLMRVQDNDVDRMEETFKVNLFSFIELVKYFSDEKMYNPGASVVAISSVAARGSSYRQTVYGASKAALEQAIRCMAKECMEKQIRINGVAPGAVETEMLKKMEEENVDLVKSIEKKYPMGTIPPQKISRIIEMLLSDDAEYMTGTIIQVDAGYWVWK